MSELELVTDKKNRVAEAVNEILFDFLIFGVLSFVIFTVVCLVAGQAQPWQGGIALAAWTFGIATIVHCFMTDGGVILLGCFLGLVLAVVYGILYCFYWLLFL
tara:strand:- start:152 stop:460 length:309 start_codon:yes stop_codon:yes gene_type:complete